MNHFTAPSFFSSFLPLESSPFFFFEDMSLPLPGLPVPLGDGGDPEWRCTVGDGALLAVPEPSAGTQQVHCYSSLSARAPTTSIRSLGNIRSPALPRFPPGTVRVDHAFFQGLKYAMRGSHPSQGISLIRGVQPSMLGFQFLCLRGGGGHCFGETKLGSNLLCKLRPRAGKKSYFELC